MKILSCISPGNFEYQTKETPILQPGHTIIAIKRIGICGTDLHAFQGTQPYFSYPRILGHELSGNIVAASDAPGFSIGEKVTIVPYFNCGTCIACINNKPNCCTQIKVCGVHIDGGMADYFSVPSYSLVHGDDLSYEELALIEPLAIGAHGIDRAKVHPGEFVLVVGAGPIGLGTMEFARIAGAQVIALDVNENRLAFCKEKLGIQHTINAKETNVLEALATITSGQMPTVVIDCTGNQQAINNALQYLAHGGRYVLIGLQKEMISFSHPEFHKRETTLMSSRNATRDNFNHVIACIKNKQVNPANYITHTTHFDNVKNEFANWLNPANGVIKAMITMDKL